MKDRYRILLVDDEPIILRSLQVVIPWEQLNIEIVGTARNGEEALQLAKEWQPDIVLCDIRMPIIDGIMVMKEVMNDDPSVIFIILSGYGEFEYAREAIRQGAFDYLLKPIDHDELNSVIGEALKRLQTEQSLSSEREYLRKSVQSLSSLVREQMLADMLVGFEPPRERLYWLQEWEFEHPYHMVVVSLDDYDQLSRQWGVHEKKLWLFAIRNILQEFGDQQHCLTLFALQSGEWIMLFQKIELDSLIKICSTMIELIQRYTKLSCSAAISREYAGLQSLGDSYQDAQYALGQKFLSGKGKVYINSEQKFTDTFKQPGSTAETNLDKRLQQAVQTLDIAGFGQILHQFEQEWVGEQCTKEAAVERLFKIAVILNRQLESMSLRTIEGMDALLQDLLHCETLQDMMLLIRVRFIEWMQQILNADKQDDGRQLILKAKEYIAGRYHHDLGIDEISEYVGLSCSHFCVLFKRETGLTFLEYLTRVRIEQACSILLHSDVKVYQIAPLVGYQDPRYFTQVFKKMMGMTPTEYRTQGSEPAPK